MSNTSSVHIIYFHIKQLFNHNFYANKWKLIVKLIWGSNTFDCLRRLAYDNFIVYSKRLFVITFKTILDLERDSYYKMSFYV